MKSLYTWTAILLITAACTTGETLLASAMKRIGDLGQLRARSGVLCCVCRVLTCGTALAGIGCMAIAFFSLLLGLSWADLSLVGPATGGLTFLTDAVTAKLILKEKVDHRRWLAAFFVGAGVLLLGL